MNPIRTVRRLACTLTGLAAALAAAIAIAPTAPPRCLARLLFRRAGA